MVWFGFLRKRRTPDVSLEHRTETSSDNSGRTLSVKEELRERNTESRNALMVVAGQRTAQLKFAKDTSLHRENAYHRNGHCNYLYDTIETIIEMPNRIYNYLIKAV